MYVYEITLPVVPFQLLVHNTSHSPLPELQNFQPQLKLHDCKEKKEKKKITEYYSRMSQTKIFIP